ncbi:MAG: isopeptide-forming domain-containing fimbrial protein [Chloroflexales bacterium]
MRIAISRVVLFAAGLTLLLAALLPSLSRSVGAAPLMLISETTTAEPPTRTATAVPPPPTNTPSEASTATSIPTAALATSTSTGDTGAPTPTVALATQTSTGDTGAPTPTVALATRTSTGDTGVPTPTGDTGNTGDSGGSGGSGKKDPTHTPLPTRTPMPTLTATPPPSLTAVVQIADPAITKSVNRSTVKIGDTVEFTITATNLGNATATGVVVEDSLPAFLALASASATRGDVRVSGSTVRVMIGDLAPGETVTVTITARVRATTVPPDNRNLATVASDSSSDDPSNNSSSVALITEAAIPALLPNTGASDGPGPLLLAALGIGLVAASLLARRRTV